jgi:hypothetical protein
MNCMRTLLAVVLALLCSTQPPALAQPATVPATAPSTAESVTPGFGAGPVIERLQAALNGVNLSDDQKARTTALLDDLRLQLRDVPNLTPEDRRDTLRQVMGDGRRKLAEILTPEQLRALRDKQQAQTGAREPAPTPPAKVRSTTPAIVATPSDAAAKPSGEPQLPADPKPAADTFTGAVGDRVPAFAMKRIPTGAVRSTAYANRVLVIEFGSYSVPGFRYRSAAMDALAKEYTGRADFVTVYTAEGYPAGAWDISRNRDDGIAIPAHPDDAARLTAAEQMLAALKPTRAIAIDPMTESRAAAFRAGVHSAFVVGRDGVIVARQQWCDPDGLRRHLDAAIAVRAEAKR